MPPLLLSDIFKNDVVVCVVDFLLCFLIAFEEFFWGLCIHKYIVGYNPVRHGFSFKSAAKVQTFFEWRKVFKVAKKNGTRLISAV